jgi:tape measure domain-containing protein
VADEDFRIRISQQGAEKVAKDVDAIGKAGQRSTSIMKQFRNALVAFASARAAMSVVEFVDGATRLSNSMKVATRSVGEYNQAMGFLRKISKESRTDMESNAQVYSRLLRSTEGLGFSTQDLEKTMEGLTYAVKVGGATSMEARNSLIQFSQALASGALRGDELRSVAEQLPALANAIGKEFNMSGGQLIAFAKANPGILETEKVVRGVMKAADELKMQFQEMTPTLSEGFTLLKTNVMSLLIDVERATGLFSGLARVLIFLAENFIAIGPAIAAAGLAAGVSALISMGTAAGATGSKLVLLATQLRLVAAAQMALNIVMAANPLVRLAVIVGLAVAAFIKLYQNSETLRFAINNIVTVIGVLWTAISDMVSTVWNAIPSFVNWQMVLEFIGATVGILAHVFSVILVAALAAVLQGFNYLIQGLNYFGLVSDDTAKKVDDIADKALEAAGKLYAQGDALTDATDKTIGFSASLEEWRSKMGMAGGAITKLAGETDELTSAEKDAAKAAEDAARKHADLTASYWDSTAAGQRLRDSMFGVSESSYEASEAIGATNDGLNTFLGIDGQVYNGLNGIASGYRNVASAASSAAAATRAANNAVSSGGGGGSSSGPKGTPLASVGGILANAGKPMNSVSMSSLPKKAAGGPVSAGQTYLVGEKGPELFTPKESGEIIANKKLGGAYEMLERQKAEILAKFKKASDFFKGGGILAGPAASHHMAMMATLNGRLRMINEAMAKIEAMNKKNERDMVKKELKRGFQDDGKINLPGFEDVGPAPKIDFQTLTPWQQSGGGGNMYSTPSSGGGSYSGGGGGTVPSGGGAGTNIDNSITVNMSITTQDAGSFRQNQAQIEGNMLAMVERAQRRKKRN